MSDQSSAPRRYSPVGPRLARLLTVVFVLLALLGANSVYLAAITFLEWVQRLSGGAVTLQNTFYLFMVLLHILLGVIFTLPFVVFLAVHLRAAWRWPNRHAVRIGYLLLLFSVAVLGTGFLLAFADESDSAYRNVLYWVHVVAPLGAVWAYVLHRLAGPPLQWRRGLAWTGAVAVFVLVMVGVHWYEAEQPDPALAEASQEMFAPALTRIASGKYADASWLQNDKFCMECHQDAYHQWFHSAHHFSSFNNPAYAFSVNNTRKKLLERDGNVHASRFCAACHDPVPLLTGKFDDPNFDPKKEPTAHAGITCTVCHAITDIHSVRGNGAYTIARPPEYPFQNSNNPILRAINRRLIKAKPELHKRAFLKPLHRTAEFCSVCHKVFLPKELTHYKEFLRGQNHYDSHRLSGVSGHGSRSFYHPPQAATRCAECHMPLVASNDFGAQRFPGTTVPSIHDHLFRGANTALPHWRGDHEIVKVHQEFLKDCVRVDLFAIRRGRTIDAPLLTVLRPQVPVLQPGQDYLLDVVVRNLRTGHHFTQGTVDSNQVWVELILRVGDRIIGRSGALDEEGRVDPWAYFLNVYMLDRYGNRIDRRNAEDIFVPLYNHQIPPGSAQAIHYRFRVPDQPWLYGKTITVEAKVHYRKFDLTYMRYVFGPDYKIDLPITLLAQDRVDLPVAAAGGDGADVPPGADPELVSTDQKSPIPTWQRWNDFGIALLLQVQGAGKYGQLSLSLRAFGEVERLGRWDGALNQARVHLVRGNWAKAQQCLDRAKRCDPPAPRWLVAWVQGKIHQGFGRWDQAALAFRSILEDRYEELRRRRFDFSKDDVVINELGLTLFNWAKLYWRDGQKQRQRKLLEQAAEVFHRTLKLNPDDLTAHYNLYQIYTMLGDKRRAQYHHRMHDILRPDDNARDVALNLARKKDPAANHAAEPIVVYDLQRRGAPGLPPPEEKP